MSVVLPVTDCWNRIGVYGDRSCPVLAEHVHCHNCPVYTAAGRRFLDAPPPPGYLAEWAGRLAAVPEQAASDLESVVVFRLGGEWLAVRVAVVVEVTPARPVHRVPFRGGLLAGLVNVRGELMLCAHLAKLLGGEPPAVGPSSRFLVTRRDADRWVFPTDEVDRVTRVPRNEIGPPPATVGRSAARLTVGVFRRDEKAVGLLDETRLFETLRTTIR